MRIKRRLRTVIESAAFRAGFLARFEREMHAGLTILTYHRVLTAAECERYPYPALAMPESAFREQMRRLAEQCEVVTVSEGVDRVASGRTGTRPLAAVTFDDGYADNAACAAPILEERGLRGTFFFVHDFVASGRELWFDRAARLGVTAGAAVEDLKRLAARERDAALDALEARARGVALAAPITPLTRAQALALVRAGHEVGSHTLSHPILTQARDEELEAEITRSKSALESWLGVDVHGFCYPNGDQDERVRSVVRRAGYRWACTTSAGRNHEPLDVFGLRRIDVTPTRVTDHAGEYSEIAFRSEISLMRRTLRGDE